MRTSTKTRTARLLLLHAHVQRYKRRSGALNCSRSVRKQSPDLYVAFLRQITTWLQSFGLESSAFDGERKHPCIVT